MHIELLEILRCPQTGQRLLLEKPEYCGERIHSGSLVSEDAKNRYPIRGFVPRFVSESNYADNFGLQWNEFPQTQLDSYSGHPISANRFWKATGWHPDDMYGKWALDVGCGAGRFAEVALRAGATVVALDYSTAVDACFANLKHHRNLHVVQGDIYALPFPKGFFPYIYSLGVLQHTPDVQTAFAALPPMLAENGQLCADFYWKRLKTLLHLKYLLRPIAKGIPKDRLFALLKRWVPVLLPLSQWLGRIPIAGGALKRMMPVADYTDIYPLSISQLQEWALLDTFDMLAPEHDNPQTTETVKHWFEQANLTGVEVFHEGHLVGRGCKKHDSGH